MSEHCNIPSCQLNLRHEHKTFGFQVEKKWQDKAAPGKQYWYLEGYASDTSLDRDGDRMSISALKAMNKAIEEGMNLFLDHKHELMNTLGVILKSELRGDRLWIQARLEDPDINPLVKQIIHKMDIGERVGLSIGGDMLAHHDEFNNTIGKSVRVIDDVALYEISAVGLPSNAGAFAYGTVFKSFDPAKAKELHKMTCNLCSDSHTAIGKVLAKVQAARKDMPFAAREGASMGYQEAIPTMPMSTTPVGMPLADEEKPPSDWLDRCVSAVEETGTADEPYAVCTATWQRTRAEEKWAHVHQSLVLRKFAEEARAIISKSHAPKA